MELFSKYENAEAVTGGQAKIFRAREISSGRPVLLHQLSSQADPGRQQHLLALTLRYLSSGSSQNPVRAVEEHEGSLWVITEDRPELLDLWQWMEQQTPASAPSGAQQPSQSAAGSEAGQEDRTSLLPRASGEATNAARSKDDRTGIGSSTPQTSSDSFETTRILPVSSGARPAESNKPERAGPAQPMAPPAAATQDSTMILQSAPPPTAKIQPAAPGSIAQGEPAPGKQPGEFTMLFRSPRSFDSQPVQQPPSPSQQAGESTLLMNTPSRPPSSGGSKLRFHGFTAPPQPSRARPETAAPRPSVPPPSPSEPAKKSPEELAAESPEFQGLGQPGEFTRFFQSPLASGSQAPAFPVESQPALTNPAQPSEFTQMFQPRAPLTGEDASFSPISPTPPAAPSKEPGAFTRIFQIPVGSDLLTAQEQTLHAVPRPLSPAPNTNEPALPSFPAPSIPPPAQNAPPSPAAQAFTVKPEIPPIPKFRTPSLPGQLNAAAPPAAAPPSAPPRLPQLSIPKPAVPAKPEMPKVPGAEKLKGAPGPAILPLILIFGGILLVAVLVVLYFATQH